MRTSIRLNTFPVTMPPLRMRVEDIPELARYFIDKYARKYGKRFETLSKNALKMLSAYSWPGNVRELEHVIERAIITSPEPVFQLVDQLEHEQVELVKVEEGSPKGFDAMAGAGAYPQSSLQKTGWKIDGEGGAGHPRSESEHTSVPAQEAGTQTALKKTNTSM